MKPELRYARFWRAASAMLLVTAFAATLVPAVWFLPDLKDTPSWFGSIDKWAHFLAFLVLAVWFCGLFERRWWLRVAAGLLVFGIFIEISQRTVGYRSAEWLDIAADGAGIIAGLVIAWLGLSGWSDRVEHWYTKRFMHHD